MPTEFPTLSPTLLYQKPPTADSGAATTLAGDDHDDLDEIASPDNDDSSNLALIIVVVILCLLVVCAIVVVIIVRARRKTSSEADVTKTRAATGHEAALNDLHGRAANRCEHDSEGVEHVVAEHNFGDGSEIYEEVGTFLG